MNYRHIYHAGNFADVLKHLVLMMVLEHLRKKDKPFYVLDAHAGLGIYDLKSEQHQKTQESAEGVLKLLGDDVELPALIQRYVDLVKACGEDKYPGSPKIIQAMMRDQDQAMFNELHPEDVETLNWNFRGDDRVRINHEDAYAAIKAFVPPPIKRGLVLIDPPFEETDEFELMLKGFWQGYKRWPIGTYALWYPIKDEENIGTFYEALAESGIPKILVAELFIRPYEQGVFCGTGLVLVNPPWGMQEALEKCLPQLCKLLSLQEGSWSVFELAGEADA